MDRSSRQGINKETLDLNYTVNQLCLTYICRTFHATIEFTFSSNTHGTFSKINRMSGHNTNINKFKKAEPISSTFSNHNGIKLEIDYEKKM